MPTTEQIASRLQAVVAAWVGRPLFWGGLVALLAGWPLYLWASATRAATLPRLGAVPSFETVDQEGHALGTIELRGRIWIAGWLDLRDPAAWAQLRAVQARARNLGEAFAILSLSREAEPGPVESLARQNGLSPVTWHLIGRSADGERARGATDGLAGALEALGSGDGRSVILIDGEGVRRGSYPIANEAQRDTLLRDIGLLVNGAHGPGGDPSQLPGR